MATVTFASPAGEGDDTAMAAEKEYVTDPSTGKQVLKPEYGGTLTTVVHAPLDHGDAWLTHGAGVGVGAALDHLGIADWAADRSVSSFMLYYPLSILRGHLAESWENTINDNYFSGLGEWQPMGPIGPAWVGYHNAFDTWPEELKKFYSYGPEGAERLLDEAGYPRGADGVRFRTQMIRPVGRADIGYHELEVGYWKEIGVISSATNIDGISVILGRAD